MMIFVSIYSVKYQFYHSSNAKWGAAEWAQEASAMAAVRIERVTVRNPLDSHWPNYSLSVLPNERSCLQHFTALFTLGGELAANPCVRQYSNTSHDQQPLTVSTKQPAPAHTHTIITT